LEKPIKSKRNVDVPLFAEICGPVIEVFRSYSQVLINEKRGGVSGFESLQNVSRFPVVILRARRASFGTYKSDQKAARYKKILKASRTLFSVPSGTLLSVLDMW
jgi:hypothetical protein